MKKILIAIPCMDTIPVQFCQSLSTLERVEQTVIAFQVGSLVYSSRNGLALEAIRQGADYIFWLDSDMMFAPGILRYMLSEIEKLEGDAILSGVYFRRMPPFSPVAYKKLDIDQSKGASWEELKEIPDGTFEVEGVGFGCVLMPTAAVIDVQTKFGTLFNPILGTGEDLSFCWRARQCGWKFYCDPKPELGHVGHHVIGRTYWDDYRDFKAQEESANA